MFIAIINDGFRRARQNLLQKDDEIVSFMWTKFQRWIGWSKSCEVRDNTMEIEYLNLAGVLRKKVHELLHALNRVYIDPKTSNFL
ncbi:unnamed protein product [Adineta ricciae]|uniref:Uncharacterized protein n=1 Tax=Adineta ricciae TaxID=249248 RepID=A0A815G461_ADIRI|nr:unnamed protein product [Adineta ricciae]CAF1374404.1 unnamed protein product [Adineta ricciae]